MRAVGCLRGPVQRLRGSQSPRVADVPVHGWSWTRSQLLCLQSAWPYVQKSAPMPGKESSLVTERVAVAWLTAVLWYLSRVHGTRFLSPLALRGESSRRGQLLPAFYRDQFSNDVPFLSKVSPFSAWHTHPEPSLTASKTGSNVIRTCLSHVSRNC